MSEWDYENGTTSAPTEGFGLGRGRGLRNGGTQDNSTAYNNDWNKNQSVQKPEPGGWQESSGGNEWDDSGNQGWGQTETTTQNWNSGGDGYSSNNRGSNDYGSRGGGGGSRGGSMTCYKCNEEGHMSRDCPNPSSNRGGGGGGRGPMKCYNCQEEGHSSRDCTQPKDSSSRGPMKCYNCQEEGHSSRDCTQPKDSSSRGPMKCYNCQEEGHSSRECPSKGSGGGGGGRGPMKCYNCQEEGHSSRDCTQPKESRGPMKCYNCQEEGHSSRDCTQPKESRGPMKCYNCQEEGHSSRECPTKDSSSRGPMKCYTCQEEGHGSRDCPNKDSQGPQTCYKCKKEGHMGRDCPDAGVGPDGEKRAPLYTPPELAQDESTLFSELSIGVNFEKQDNAMANVTGKDPPKPIQNFADAGLGSHLLNNIVKSHYTRPTPVQKYAIPIVLGGRDLMACAQTGSGKTAAFLIPIFQTFMQDPDLPNNRSNPIQEPLALIISPTRELAIQIATECRKFAYDSVVKTQLIYGGTSTWAQSSRLAEGCHVLVATPGRLNDFIEKRKISLRKLKYLVLDEADRMLDMGFLPEIKRLELTDMTPKESRQTLMFSATFPEEIQKLAQDFLNDYLFLTIGMVGAANEDVVQTMFLLPYTEKRDKLVEILQGESDKRCLIFVEQKRSADFLASFLCQSNLKATSIHGDRLQREREEALNDFRGGRMHILVATAVAARGLDIKDVAHVINYDLPQTIDEYVHRIGRTGRVGNIGQATSFYDSGNDQALARPLVKILSDANQVVPDWLEEEAKNATGTGGGGFGGGRRFGGKDFRSDNRGGGGGGSYNTESTNQWESGNDSSAAWNNEAADEWAD